MSYIKNPDHLEGLSIITSCGCNLNCEYCYIAKAKNKNSANLQAATIKALDDGTFLKNIQQVLLKIGESPESIRSLAFWGQEPTLTLHLISKHLQDWFDLFPNWDACMFSTNTIAHYERIIDYVVALDKTTKHPFFLDIQLSYDGDYGTDNFRGIETSAIYNNVKNMILGLNDINLHNVHVRFNFHGVMSMELLKTLQDCESIFNYIQSLGEWGLEFYELVNNSNVRFSHSGVDVSIENPVQAGINEGMQLRNFCAIANKFTINEMYPNHVKKGIDIPPSPHGTLYSTYFNVLNCIEHMGRDIYHVHTMDELLLLMANDEKIRHEVLDKLNYLLYCGNGVGELKIMYDGTLVNCQNHIYDTQIEYLPNETDLMSSVKRSLATHKYFVNPLKDSDYDLQKYFSLFNSCKHSCLEFIFRTSITTMQYLLWTHQIDASYYNTDKLTKHALLVSMFNCCSYNNQMMTGSLFLRHSGFMRLLCNGFIDLAIEEYNKGATERGFLI